MLSGSLTVSADPLPVAVLPNCWVEVASAVRPPANMLMPSWFMRVRSTSTMRSFSSTCLPCTGTTTSELTTSFAYSEAILSAASLAASLETVPVRKILPSPVSTWIEETGKAALNEARRASGSMSALTVYMRCPPASSHNTMLLTPAVFAVSTISLDPEV